MKNLRILFLCILICQVFSMTLNRYEFDISFSNGFSAHGRFSTTNDLSFEEASISNLHNFTTAYVRDFEFSIFTDSNKKNMGKSNKVLLQEGVAVRNNVGFFKYFTLKLENGSVIKLDAQTTISRGAQYAQQAPFYFITNLFDSNEQPVVTPGPFNLFLDYTPNVQDASIFLATSNSVELTLLNSYEHEN